MKRNKNFTLTSFLFSTSKRNELKKIVKNNKEIFQEKKIIFISSNEIKIGKIITPISVFEKFNYYFKIFELNKNNLKHEIISIFNFLKKNKEKEDLLFIISEFNFINFYKQLKLLKIDNNIKFFILNNISLIVSDCFLSKENKKEYKEKYKENQNNIFLLK